MTMQFSCDHLIAREDAEVEGSRTYTANNVGSDSEERRTETQKALVGY